MTAKSEAGSPQSSVPDKAICWDCNYPLRGLTSHRCPECGRGFDPLKPETMNVRGLVMPNWLRWLLRPVGWPTHLLALWAFVYPLWELRRPGGGFHAQVAAFLFWLIVIVVWLGRLALRHIVAGVFFRPRSEFARWNWNWFAAPVLLIIFTLIPSDWPFRLAFAYSRRDFNRFVAQAMVNPSAMAGTHRLGVYWVTIDAVQDGGLLLFTGHGYDASRCGFAYFPTPPRTPAETEFLEYFHIEGPWYEYWEHNWPSRFPATLPTTFPSTRPASVSP